MSVSIRPNHTRIGVPQWRHHPASTVFDQPIPDMTGLTVSDGTDYDLVLPDSVWLTVMEDLQEHFARKAAESKPKPGDACLLLGDFKVEHRGCDEHPDGVITDARTGKVVAS